MQYQCGLEPLRLYETSSLLMAYVLYAGAVWWSESVHLGARVRTPINQISIYRVHYFAERSDLWYYYEVNNVIRKMNLSLLRSFLLTINKSFVRPHLDYGVIHDQPNKSSLSDKIESVQYNAVFVITAAIWGTSKEKLYLELALESLRNWSG